MTPTLPHLVADDLLRRIFEGELAPGERLPPQRDLAESLGVDRSSLRMGLKQLERMGLVSSVQGSGMTINDYREKGGIEFLAAVFSLPDPPAAGTFLAESLDVFVAVFPALLATSTERSTPERLRTLEGIFARQLEALADYASLEEIVALEVEAQDAVARSLDNVIIRLIFNSTRPLRRHLTREFLMCVDPEEHVRTQRRMLRLFATGALGAEQVEQGYRLYLKSATAPLRAALLTGDSS